MSGHSGRHRNDANRDQVVKWLEEDGAEVIPIGEPFDFLVGMFGRWDLVELKTVTGTVKQTQAKRMMDMAARGAGAPVILATTRAEIVDEMRRRARGKA